MALHHADRRLLHFPQSTVLSAALLLFAAGTSAEDRYQVLHDFDGQTNPDHVVGLIQASDDSLYGTTLDGGDFDTGILFRLTLGGTFSIVHSFPRDARGPNVVHLQLSDGSFLVSTGANEGTIYRITSDGTSTVFLTGVYPLQLVEATDGLLYGLGFVENHPQSFFRVNSDKTVTVLHQFVWGSDEGESASSLIQASDGNFYGTNQLGPDGPGGGTLFRFAPDGTIAILHHFELSTAVFPNSLFQGPDGALYGMGDKVENYISSGVAFRVALNGDFRVLHVFPHSMGVASRLLGSDGSVLHGYVTGYPSTQLKWFSMTPDGSVNVVSTFEADSSRIIRGRDGWLYGAVCCLNGSLTDRIARFSAGGVSTILHTFTHNSKPAHPQTPLVEGVDGNLYGMTAAGGRLNLGTLYRLSRTGRVDVLHEFVGGPGDGSYPHSLVQANDGNLYGLTGWDGRGDNGAIFRFSQAGDFAIVYRFAGTTDGIGPRLLIQANDGFLYGTTGSRSPSYAGTIFRFDTSTTTLSVAYAFGNGPSDYGGPSVFIEASDGSFYGATGGSMYANRGGTIFRWLPDGTYIPLHTLDRISEGGEPGTLVEGTDGSFYGATFCYGTIFRMTPAGAVTVLTHLDYRECDGDGAYPNSSVSLIPAAGGGVIGARFSTSNDLFSMTAEGALTVLHTYTEQNGPTTLMRARSGNLYGTTAFGGPSNSGTVFRYNLKPESLIFIDRPVEAQVLVEPFVMSGWAFDAASLTDAGVDAMHVWAYPNPGSGQAPVFVGVATIGRPRPDVGAYFAPQFAAAGFELAVRGLAPGPYQFVVFTHHTMTGSFDDARVVNVTIAPNAPMAIDQPVNGATVFGSVHVSGWAVDRAAASGTGVSAVHVWAYPNPGSGQPPFFVGAASYGGARPDVGAIFGAQFTNSAYDLTVNGLAPGDYQFVVFAYSTVSQSFSTAMTVTVHAPASQAMAVDVPIDGATVSGPFTISGWAIDRAAVSGPGVDAVHVWAYPNPGSGQAPFFVGAATYGGARPDVGAIFGLQFTHSGFTLMAPALPPGRYQLVVFARSRVSGTFDNARVVRVVTQ